MQKKFVAVIAAALISLVTLTGCAPAGVKIDAPVQIRSFQVVVSAASDHVGGTTAAEIVFKNTSDVDAELESVTTEEAGSVTFAKNVTVDGKTEAKMFSTPISIPAGKTVTLSTERVYVLVLGLKKPLLAGDSIDLTLNFSDGSKTTLEFPARIPMAPVPSNSASNDN